MIFEWTAHSRVLVTAYSAIPKIATGPCELLGCYVLCTPCITQKRGHLVGCGKRLRVGSSLDEDHVWDYQAKLSIFYPARIGLSPSLLAINLFPCAAFSVSSECLVSVPYISTSLLKSPITWVSFAV